MHLAAAAWRAVWRNSSEARDSFRTLVDNSLRTSVPGPAEQFSEYIADAIAAAAVLHDVGHPPFSHALENFYVRHADKIFGSHSQITAALRRRSGIPFHEVAGDLLLESLLTNTGAGFREIVIQIYRASPSDGTWAGALHSIVAGSLDVDRLDYLMRDARRAGTEYGGIDYERLLDALEIRLTGEGARIGPGVRARSAAEMLLVQRAQSYKWVYFHPRVVAADLFLERALNVLADLTEANESFPAGNIGTIFNRLFPHLNYLSADLDAMEVAMGLQEPPQDGILHSAPLERFVEPDRWQRIAPQIGSQVQAAADDSSILASLARAYLAAIYIRTTYDVYSMTTKLEDLERYYKASVLRAKNFYMAWKSYEEFVDVAQRVVASGLPESIRRVISVVRAECGGASGVEECLQEYEEHLISMVEDDPVLGINAIANLVVRGRGQRFANYMNQRSRALDDAITGAWEATFRDFAPIRKRTEVAVLFQDTGPDVRLSETSPLVAALDQVENHRIKLFVFYFVISMMQSWEEFASSTFRAKIRDAFVDSFPGYVEQELVMPIKELVMDAIEGTEDGSSK